MRRLFVLLSVLAVAIAAVLGQTVETVADRIDRQRFEFPQEKIHVMTDRGSYMAGDTIWLRAWVVDATTHQPVNASRFVYVELMSPSDSVFTRVKLHSDDDGVFQGYVPLDVIMPEGRYQLIAYTMFMQSVGADYFYRQSIDVMSLLSMRQRIVSRCVRDGDQVDVTLRYENVADSSLCPYHRFGYMSGGGLWLQRGGGDKEMHLTLKGKDAQLPVLQVQFDNYDKYIPLPQRQDNSVIFYPEGGYLVPGVENLVAFKVHDPNALAVSDGGELRDSGGHVVARLKVEHDGMGVLAFTPKYGETYKACWRDLFDQEVAYDLPVVRDDATVVQVRRVGGVVSMRAVGAHATGSLLVLQQRGRYVTEGFDSLTIDEKSLEPGVAQVLLFDDTWRCLSERLFYATGQMLSSLPLVTDRDDYNDRDHVQVTMDLSDVTRISGNHCAVAVVDDNSTVTTGGNIYANLLLQSELRGHINNPAYYFDTVNASASRVRHLDMLMLTQGWRRYDIPRVLRGRIAQPQYPIEVSQVVTGQVLSDWRKKPVVGGSVSLIAPRVSYSNVVTTDSLGEFTVALPLIFDTDSAECVVKAENIKGKKQMNLEVAKDVFPVNYYVANAAETPVATASIVDEQAWRMAHDGDWRHVMLNELLVQALRPRRNPMAGSPYSLTSKKIADKDIRSLEDAVREIPGLWVMNGALYTAGDGTERNRVFIYVDGEKLDAGAGADDAMIMEELRSANNNDSPQLRLRMAKLGVANYSVNSLTFSRNPDLTVAEGMVSMKHVDYMYLVRDRHGGALYIQHKPGRWTGGGEPSIYLKIIEPMGAQHPVEFYSSRYDLGNGGIEQGTDLRSVVYWNPCVSVGSDGKASFDFFATDAHNTTYTILVEGVTPDGSLVRATRQVAKH